MTRFEKATYEVVDTWSEDDIVSFASSFGIPLHDPGCSS